MRELFQPYLRDSIKKSGMKLSGQAEDYILNVLIENSRSEKYNPKLVVADVLVLAAASYKVDERFRLYIEIGDYSLFSAGFFVENLMQRSAGIEYYLNAGAASYDLAYSICGNNVFKELSDKYCETALMLGDISDELFSNKMEKTVTIFDCWRNNKSDFLKKRLARLGLFVDKGFYNE